MENKLACVFFVYSLCLIFKWKKKNPKRTTNSVWKKAVVEVSYQYEETFSQYLIRSCLSYILFNIKSIMGPYRAPQSQSCFNTKDDFDQSVSI